MSFASQGTRQDQTADERSAPAHTHSIIYLGIAQDLVGYLIPSRSEAGDTEAFRNESLRFWLVHPVLLKLAPRGPID